MTGGGVGVALCVLVSVIAAVIIVRVFHITAVHDQLRSRGLTVSLADYELFLINYLDLDGEYITRN